MWGIAYFLLLFKPTKCAHASSVWQTFQWWPHGHKELQPRNQASMMACCTAKIAVHKHSAPYYMRITWHWILGWAFIASMSLYLDLHVLPYHHHLSHPWNEGFTRSDSPVHSETDTNGSWMARRQTCNHCIQRISFCTAGQSDFPPALGDMSLLAQTDSWEALQAPEHK